MIHSRWRKHQEETRDDAALIRQRDLCPCGRPLAEVGEMEWVRGLR